MCHTKAKLAKGYFKHVALLYFTFVNKEQQYFEMQQRTWGMGGFNIDRTPCQAR
jgi:hypothetical protein